MNIYFDGRYLKIEQHRLATLAPGHIVGRGVFETMIFYQGHIPAWSKHMERLQRGLKLLKIKSPSTISGFNSKINVLMKRERLINARIRLMVWDGGKAVHESIVVQKLVLPSAEKYQAGYKVMISSHRRNPSAYSSIKTINYQAFHQAHQEALAKKFDEAILLNDDKHVVEGAYSNIFAVHQQTLYTPPVSDGCLNGITRNIVLSLARALGLKCKMKSFSPVFLAGASEAFLTNSVIGVMPLASTGRRLFSRKRLVTTQLAATYQKWLSHWPKSI